MDGEHKSTTEYFEDRRRKDQELFEQWKKTGTKRDLGNLMTQLDGVIFQEVKRQSGTLPTSALTAEAQKWAYKAIQTYDPSKGTQLSTHVANYLQKTRRMNYKYQNAVRLPENLHLKWSEYNTALQNLTEELNREPTDDELSKKLGWSKPRTIKFKNSLYADLIESSSERPGEYTQFNESAILMEHLMNQLDYQEKFILDNSKSMSSTELANKLGVNLNRLNYLKAKLVTKIKRIKEESGMY